MAKTAKAASFEDFLEAPVRLAEQEAEGASASSKKPLTRASEPLSSHLAERSNSSSKKVKVGLTIDEDIIDAIDDYIYLERKKGRRLKKNDVYEAALRQFLGLTGGDV